MSRERSFSTVVGMLLFLIATTLPLLCNSEFIVHRVSLENARQVREIIAKNWDFSECAPGCELKLGEKVLNRRRLIFSPLEAARLLPLLHGEQLADRMYVWGEVAASSAEWLKENGQNVTSFSVEELDKLEGDIVIGRETADNILSHYSGENDRSKRKAVSFENLLWTKTIPYQFQANTFSAGQINLVKQAVKHWQDETCVRFSQKASATKLSGPHIKFVKKSGCWSFIGQQRRGQELSLGSTCFRMGVIAHEIGHALGLYHEQSRPDRDKYITINYGNINGNPGVNFGSKNWRFVQTLNIPYDYSSALHYGAYDFTKNRKPTITPKDKKMEQVLGQREKMSFFDLKIVNLLYCSEKCGGTSLEWNYCQNGGYRDPNNCRACKCPDGFAPPSCAEPIRGVNTFCGRRNLLATDKENFLKSPGYPSGYAGDADCAWRIRAPKNQRLRLQFKGQFYIQAIRPTCRAYVEVRYKDVTRVGPRYCWFRPPEDIFLTHGEEALILFHTKKAGYRGFQLSYKAETCGGCSPTSESTESVCYATKKYDCSQETLAICVDRLCIKKRENTCTREEAYCCLGYNKIGNDCVRSLQNEPAIRALGATTPEPTTTTSTTTTTTTTSTTTSTTTTTTPVPTTTRSTTPSTTERALPSYEWGPWLEWSQCSSTCGLCGNTVRNRRCIRGVCPGERRQVRACGIRACPETPPIQIRRLCDRSGKVCPFPINDQCKGARLCIQEIPALRCCAGKHVLNECVLENLKLS